MNEHIDIYCERLSTAFWAEPINALTNLSFIIAAFFAFLYARKQGKLDVKAGVLLVLLCFIGVGSFLFHTLAVRWSLYADVLPILLYQIAFILLYATGVMRLGALKTGLLFGLFIVLTAIAENIPTSILNGSLSYAPSISFLLGFGVWQFFKKQEGRYTLVLAGLVFIASLTFRTMDMAVCPAFAIGTHFLWHSLNGVVLYLSTRAYLNHKN